MNVGEDEEGFHSVFFFDNKCVGGGGEWLVGYVGYVRARACLRVKATEIRQCCYIFCSPYSFVYCGSEL